jgi:hypothetical protein
MEDQCHDYDIYLPSITREFGLNTLSSFTRADAGEIIVFPEREGEAESEDRRMTRAGVVASGFVGGGPAG